MNRLVTLGTRQSFMFSVQFKTGIVMVKFYRLPVVVCVTKNTVIYTIYFKLCKMNIVMTIRTHLFFPFKLLRKVSISTLPEMTFPAGNPGMFSQECKIGGIMVKLNLTPFIY